VNYNYFTIFDVYTAKYCRILSSSSYLYLLLLPKFNLLLLKCYQLINCFRKKECQIVKFSYSLIVIKALMVYFLIIFHCGYHKVEFCIAFFMGHLG